MNKFLNIIVLVLALFVFGCASVQTKYDPATGINQIHAYDNSALNTSSKLSLYQQCDKGKESAENCKPIGTYHSDTTGLIPSVGGQALIGLGLSESGDDNHSVGGSTVVDNSCQGNCAGKRKAR